MDKNTTVSLSDKEKQDFDNISADGIREIKDVAKLKRLEAYMRQEGFPTTADVVKARLAELGLPSSIALDPETAKEVANDREQLLKDLKFKQKQFKEVDLRKIEHELRPPDAAVPVRAASGISGNGSKLLTGPQLTQHIIAQNQNLTEVEKNWNAEQEKQKGNDSFRAKEYAEAIEHYSISLGYSSRNASVYANRAAAYIRLKMWVEAEMDCNSALETDPGNLKALIRRATSRLEQSKIVEAMEDVTAALAKDPTNKEILALRDKGEQKLGKRTTKKMVIEEVSEDDDDNVVKSQPSGGKKTKKAETSGPKTGAQTSSDMPSNSSEPTKISPKSQVTGTGKMENKSSSANASNGTGRAERTRITVVEVSSDEDEAEATELPIKIASAASPKPGTSKAAENVAKASVPNGSSAENMPLSNQPNGNSAAVLSKGAPTELRASTGIRKKITVVEESESESENEMPAPTSAPSIESPITASAPTVSVQEPAKVASASTQAEHSVAAKRHAPDSKVESQAGAQASNKKEKIEHSEGANTVQPTTSQGRGVSGAQEGPKQETAEKLPGNISAAAVKADMGPGIEVTTRTDDTEIEEEEEEDVLVPSVPLPKPLDTRALELKEAGNKSFQAGKNAEAVRLYTEALEFTPDSAVLFTNRAVARLRLHEFKAAHRDASIALSLDRKYYKAYHRRGQAKFGLGDLHGALGDLRQALTFADPKDAAAIQVEIDQLDQKLTSERQTAAAEAAKKRVSSTFKYKGVTIEELGSDEEDGDGGHSITRDQRAVQRQLEKAEASAAGDAMEMKRRAKGTQEAWEKEVAAAQEHAQALQAAAAAKKLAKKAELQEKKARLAAAAAASVQTTAVVTPSERSVVINEQMEALSSSQPGAPGVEASGTTNSQTAEMMKEEANALFRNQQTREAIAIWSQALSHPTCSDALNLQMRLNLALALNQIEEFGVALTHCQAVLAKEPVNHKALHRRARALKGLGRLEEALEDLRALSKVRGPSVEIDKDIEETVELLKAREAEGVTKVEVVGVSPSGSMPAVELETNRGVSGIDATAAAGAGVAGESTADGISNADAIEPGPAVSQDESVVSNPVTQQSSSSVTPTTSAASKAAAPEKELPVPRAEQVSGATSVSLSSVEQPAAAVSSQQATSTPEAQKSASAAAPSKLPSVAVTAEHATAAMKSQPLGAESRRQAGNELFKQGKLLEAISEYTAALAADPQCTHSYANRALCRLRLGDAEGALEDCTAALKLDPKNSKARHRSAKALTALGRLREAIAAYEAVVREEPGEKGIARELADVRRALMNANAKGKAPARVTAPSPIATKIKIESDSDEDEGERARMFGRVTPSASSTEGGAGPSKGAKLGLASTASSGYSASHGQTRNTNTPPIVSSAKPSQTIAQTKIGVEAGAAEPRSQPAAAAAASTAAGNTTQLGQAGATRLPSQPVADAKVAVKVSAPADSTQPQPTESTASPVSKTSAANGISKPKNASSADKAPIATATAASDQVKSPNPVSSSGQAPEAASQLPPTEKPTAAVPRPSIHESAAAKAAAAMNVAKLASQRPAPPKSAIDVERALKMLGADRDGLFDYVHSLPLEGLNRIFKESITASSLSGILKGVEKGVESDPVWGEKMLRALSGVSRFSMVTMALSRADKEVASRIIGKVVEATGSDVQDLKKVYKLQ